MSMQRSVMASSSGNWQGDFQGAQQDEDYDRKRAGYVLSVGREALIVLAIS